MRQDLALALMQLFLQTQFSSFQEELDPLAEAKTKQKVQEVAWKNPKIWTKDKGPDLL